MVSGKIVLIQQSHQKFKITVVRKAIKGKIKEYITGMGGGGWEEAKESPKY